MIDWIKVLDRSEPWQKAYPQVAEAARRVLKDVPTERPVSTKDLVALLGPVNSGSREAQKAVTNRMYQALAALASHDLEPYVTIGEPELTRRGPMIKRKLWHRKIEMTQAERDAMVIESIRIHNPDLYEKHYATTRRMDNDSD
jgi:hypothetical protein